MNRLAFPLALAALSGAAPLAAKPLVVATGESWIFTIERGQPAGARRVAPTAKPRSGEVQVSVRSMMGTTMSISSNNKRAYTFRAELLGIGTAVQARSCTLPADGRPALESWPQAATAVRLSDFKPAPAAGSCP
jgi:hypothetical protein